MATIATGRGTQPMLVSPTHCVNGHELAYPNVQRFYLPCGCAGGGGHNRTRCWTCGDVRYDPPHDVPMGLTFPDR
jgi:hypothetical protein